MVSGTYDDDEADDNNESAFKAYPTVLGFQIPVYDFYRSFIVQVVHAYRTEHI